MPASKGVEKHKTRAVCSVNAADRFLEHIWFHVWSEKCIVKCHTIEFVVVDLFCRF